MGNFNLGVIKDLINSDTQYQRTVPPPKLQSTRFFYPIDFFDETVITSLQNDVIHESPNSIIFKSEDLDLHTIADEVGLLVLPSLKCNCPSCPKAENLFEFCNLSSREQTIKSVVTFETLNQVCNSDEFLNSIKSVFYRSTSIEVLEEIKEIDEIGLTPIKVIKVYPNFNKPPYKVLTSSQFLLMNN